MAELTAARVSTAPVAEVLRWLDGSEEGLTSAEAASRLIRDGPNAVRTHRVSALAVLGRQLRSALLVLPAATAALSFFLGDRTQAAIIGAILVASIALGSSMNIAPNVPLLHCIPASTTRPSCVATDNLPRSTSWIWWWVT